MTTKEGAQEYTKSHEENQSKENYSERKEWYRQAEGTPLYIRRESVESERVIVTFMRYVLAKCENEQEALEWIKNNTLNIALNMMLVVYDIESKSKTNLEETEVLKF